MVLRVHLLECLRQLRGCLSQLPSMLMLAVSSRTDQIAQRESMLQMWVASGMRT